ncbi:MAG TPA: Ig-like domain repeat protein [Acidobacteriaceae bacterium]|nr:Ig-like domain repeat protein [Acidobacteriaceae bacterium]
MLGLFGLGGVLHAQVSTTTTLSMTDTSGSSLSSVDAGSVVVLTASVTQAGNGSKVTAGTVSFCDAHAAHCEDGYLFGAAQLTSKGTAIFKFRPAPGERSYKAVFHGTTSNAASSSSTENLTVAGGPFATTTSIAQSGSAGAYTLTATMSSTGNPPLLPAEPMEFLDTTNDNYVLGSASLAASSSTSSYAPYVGYNSGLGPSMVLVADFNQDGIPDLLTADEANIINGTDYIGILLGKGDGTFQSVAGYNFNGNTLYPSAMAVGDLNGDGYPDVVVADVQTQQLYVLMNDGTGDGRLGSVFTYTFPTWNDPTNGQQNLPVAPIDGIAIGDVNGDGKPDVLVTFTQFQVPNTDCGNYRGCGAFGVMLGNGDGTLKMGNPNPPWVPSYLSGFTGGYQEDVQEPIALVDTRGNGKLDAVITEENIGQVCVSLGNGDGTFAGANCYGSPNGPSFAVGDFNGDGIPDLFVTSLDSANGSSGVLLGKGDGSFQSTIAGPPAGVNNVAAGDLNGDGKLDVVLTGNGATEDPGTFLVLYGNGDGTFGAANTVNATADGDYLISAAVADLNGDGVLDVAAVDPVATANVMLGSLSTTVTATLTGVSPVGASGTTHAVEANYPGDSYYSGSASTTTSLSAQPIPTTLALASNLSTVTVGGQVTLTATASPNSVQDHSPGGAVTFSMNGNSIGAATPSNGVATLHPNLTVVQTDTFTAAFAGDSNFVSSNSSTPVVVQVQKAATTLTLQVCIPGTSWICPAGTSTYGQSIQVTATLAPYNVSGGSSTDGEIVTFLDNGVIIGTEQLMDGSAALPIAEPVAGSHAFTASYGGDASFIASSTSSSSALTVQKAASSMSLTTSPVSSTSYGQQVILTATFGPYTGSSDTVNGETVTFYNGSAAVGTATLSGLTAVIRLNDLAVGSYSFTVSYPADANFLTSASGASQFSVQKLATGLVVSPSPSGASLYGSPITLQAFLEPWNVPSGNATNGELVTFYQNGISVGTGTLINGEAMFTVNVPPVGNDAYTASYAGDASFGLSNASAATVTVVKASTTMGITTSAAHGVSASGQPVILTATLAPYAEPGGASTDGDSVTFYNGANPIGTGTLMSGAATFVVNGLTAGSYTFTASYQGDTNFNGSTASPSAGLLVLQSTTLTLATSPANFAALNQGVSLSATLSPYSLAGNSTNGELISFFDGTTDLATAPLVNGVATWSSPNGLPQGSYSLTAVYQGDANLAASNTSATPLAFSVATIENFVVNVNSDDAGTASNCTPQNSTTHNTGDGACSLRDAMLAAANAPEGANITFDANAFAAASTITLTNGTLTLPANTTLAGPTLHSGPTLTNLVTVNGNGASIYQTSSTVFTVTGTGSAMSNLIVTGGWPWINSETPVNGGGIANSGALTLTNCTIANNGTVFSGGGIYNTGTLTVVGSTIAGNSAADNGPGQGGGIDNEGNGTLNVINSTIANNSAQDGYGGGIAVGSGTATITNVTISGNTVGGGGGGIYNVSGAGGGAVALGNSIVSGNIDFLTDIKGSYTDNGGNIVGTYNLSVINNPNNLNLSGLGNFGGATQTMLPLPGSPAICAGTIGNSPSQWQPQSVQIDTDQRGYPNYNINYGQLRFSGTPLPSVCFDAGAVQTNYTSVQIQQSSYNGTAGGAVTPTVVAGIIENGANRGSVPLTLSYSGPGNLSGNTATTVDGAGATFPGLSVDTAGSGTLSTTLIIAGTSWISGSTSLSVLPTLAIAPGSGTIFAGAGNPFSQPFTVSGGSGNYQLTSSGTLPLGLTLTPPGTATGTGWTLSGTPSQDGTFTLTLTATDVTNSAITGSQTYTLSVAPSTSTTLAASPASSAPAGQPITLTATVSSPAATGTVTFFDGGNPLSSGAISVGGGSPNTATLALNASTPGSPLAFGSHSFTAQYSGDANDGPSTSNTLAYNVTAPNFVVNTTADDNGSFACTALASATSNTTDGNNGGNPGLCTLRDAVNAASGVGAGGVYFDTTVFAASNLVGNPAANTIAADVPDYGSINLPSNTTIQGLTAGSGPTLANLITVDGGGSGLANNGTIFTANGTNVAMNNLNLNNGYASNGGSGGAITNFGSITISGSAFTGNQATASGGGIFNAFGGTVTVANSTFAGNSALGGNGGAIDNANIDGCGTTTVTSSTFFQNTAVNGGSGLGGAINNDGNGPCTLTVNSSTMVGNSADAGGAIYSYYLLYLANDVITGNINTSSVGDDLDDGYWSSNYWIGNNLTLGNNIINGNLIGIWNGLTENGTSVALAPLASYGGPMQTMIPLPGSAAICAGLAANIGGGIITDQRGYPNTSTTYSGYSVGKPCVDAGAVQTNYSLYFSAPVSNMKPGVATSPAPAVTLDENGSPFAGASVTIPLTLSGTGTLTGGSAATSGGVATYSALTILAPGTGDKLKAKVSLNPAISAASPAISASSGTFRVTAGPPVGWAPTAVDSTTGNATVGQSDSVLITGWAADPQDGSPMNNVNIYIDGNLAGTPTLGLASSGFATSFNNSAYSNAKIQLLYPAASLSVGTHAVTVVAINSLGLSRTFGPTDFTVAATSGTGYPVGWTPTAVDSTTGSTTVGQSDSVLITGWVADPQDGSPMNNVNIYIDGNLAGTPTLGLASSGFATSFNNSAYGNAKIQLLYPAASLSVGTHAVTVVAINSLGLSKSFGPAMFTVAASAGNSAPVGWPPTAVDNATGSTTVSQADSVVVTGWVADPHDGSPVSIVKVYIDGTLTGNPTVGLASPSFATSLNNPAYGNARIRMVYPAASLSVGTHSVTVMATNSLGLSKTFGPASFTVQ